MVSRETVQDAIEERSAHFRQLQDEITPRKCRRVLEEDLGLPIGKLDEPVLKRVVKESLQSLCVEVKILQNRVDLHPLNKAGTNRQICAGSFSKHNYLKLARGCTCNNIHISGP